MTLNKNENIEDEEAQNRALKDCHQRCADRTLKVLEKNGSIFIKLGQHLVSGTQNNKCVYFANVLEECYELPPAYRMDRDLHTATR